jgi:hypothetical protein
MSVEKWLDQFLEHNEFDIVHITSAISMGVFILRSVKRANIPLILTLMDFWFICPSIQLLRSDGNLCDGKTSAWECQACLIAGSHLFQKWKKISLPFTRIYEFPNLGISFPFDDHCERTRVSRYALGYGGAKENFVISLNPPGSVVNAFDDCSKIDRGKYFRKSGNVA